MDTRVPDYDPTIIELFAERLYAKAASFVVGSVVAGAALGAGFGAVPLTSLGASWPVPSSFGFATLLVGGVAGAVIGYLVGETRGFSYRLQAQTALCQLQIERNSAAAAEVAAAVPVGAPAPVPMPVPQPQPQQVEPVAQPVQPVPPPQPELQLRPVVIPAETPVADYSSLLRVATPIDD
jgi:hypothetical protein